MDGFAPLDLVLGLPAHPLLVHIPVVILPIAAIGLIAIVLVPRLRPAFGWVVLAALLVGAGGSLLAKESGEALAARVGWPGDHADLGDRLPLVAFALLAVAIAWFVLMRRDSSRPDQGSGIRRTTLLTRLVGAVACVLAIATIVLTILVGHSGAVAVWSGRIEPSAAGSASNAPASSAATSSATASSEPALTMDEVARHGQATDCWSVVDGRVYDLTTWIDQHPGGVGPIEGMCGVDATDAFTAMHGSQQQPNDVLAGFELGPLVR